MKEPAFEVLALGDLGSEELASEQPAFGMPAPEKRPIDEFASQQLASELAFEEPQLSERRHQVMSSDVGRPAAVDSVQEVHQHFVAVCSLLWVGSCPDTAASLCVSNLMAPFLRQTLAACAGLVALTWPELH